MINERIVEAVCYCCRKILAVLFIQRKNRNNFLEQELVHEAVNCLVVHAVADNVLSGKISAENKAGVRAVQDADLSLLVRSNFGYDMYVEAGLLERQFLRERFRSFDIPYTKDLADIEKCVLAEIFAKAPVLDVLQNALSEFLSVVVDQLAGEDCNTLLTCLETLVEKYGQLCGE